MENSTPAALGDFYCYFVDAAGHIQKRQDICGATEEAAIDEAERLWKLLDFPQVELWTGARCVRTFRR